MVDNIVEPLITVENENIQNNAVQHAVDKIDRGDEEHMAEFVPSLPEGKDKYFFVSYSSDDSKRVFSYVEELERRFKLSCVYADRDFQPGKDISENVKEGMARSLKVLLFLSPNFHASPWCRFEREFAFITSIENGVNCVIPVLLEQCEIPSTLITLTYVDATNQDLDVPERIASALVQTFTSDGFLPENLTSALTNYENGYSYTISGERQPTMCPCRPSNYKFNTSEELYDVLKRHRVEIPNQLLQKSIEVVNKSPVMWSYDYMKRFNILIWLLMSWPFFMLLWMFSVWTYLVTQATRTRPTIDQQTETTNGYWITTIVYYVGLCVVGICLAIIIYICGRRKQRDACMSLQQKLWRLFADEYIRHNVLVIFSGWKNSTPNLHIMRYNLSNCKEYLKRVFMDKNPGDDVVSAEHFADSLIRQRVSDMLPQFADDFDSLPEAPYNRHNVRKSKMCLCQELEHLV